MKFRFAAHIHPKTAGIVSNTNAADFSYQTCSRHSIRATLAGDAPWLRLASWLRMSWLHLNFIHLFNSRVKVEKM
jgi:hypothetical protein